MTTFTQSTAFDYCISVGLDETQAKAITDSWDIPWPPTPKNISAEISTTVGCLFIHLVESSHSSTIKDRLLMRLVEPLTSLLDYVDNLLSRIDNETKARNYAWRQSIEKGIKLCRENGHEGDAQTLEDIINFIEQG